MDTLLMKNEDSSSPSKISSLVNEKPITTGEKCSSHKKSSPNDAIKLPYPVLSDHRELSTVLTTLQKETQSTSKKIIDLSQRLETCEKRLISTSAPDQEKKMLKSNRVKFKQQLDGLKKHERRVSLQIDYITTKTEIKGLEDKRKQNEHNDNDEHKKQIEILLGKLKQKSEKMKIYMRTRNEQTKKLSDEQAKPSQSSQNKRNERHSLKRPMTSNSSNFSTTKRSRMSEPAVRLATRFTTDDPKHHQTTRTLPIVRFVNKTSDSRINSASPTTPASSSSTLSSPLVQFTSHIDSRNSNSQEEKLSNNDEEDDFGSDIDVDDLFTDDDKTSDSCFQQRTKRSTR